MIRHVGHADYQAIFRARHDSTRPVNQNEKIRQLTVMSNVQFRHQTGQLRMSEKHFRHVRHGLD